MHPFGTAVEQRDEAAIQAMLAEAVVFTSPVSVQPYVGKSVTAAILLAVLRVFENFHYVREIADSGGRDCALVFETTVSGNTLTGCDFLHFDDEGLIDDFMVMLRPLSGAAALSDALGAQFKRMQRDGLRRFSN
jgi:hypothetical protein